MSLPIEVYIEHDVKHPAMTDALARASALIDNWLEYGQTDGRKDEVHALLVGWPFVALAEAIAEAILEANGYDLDELHEALASRSRTGFSLGDVYAAWRPSWLDTDEVTALPAEAARLQNAPERAGGGQWPLSA